jgi:hypothetical protein
MKERRLERNYNSSMSDKLYEKAYARNQMSHSDSS